jgi:hypothetical protein
MNSSSKKQAEALESNRESILNLWEPRQNGMVKQQGGWAKRKGPWLVWSKESIRMDPIVVGLLHFPAAR